MYAISSRSTMQEHHLSNKKSMRKIDGFPTTVGSLPVEPTTAPTIHPAPAHFKKQYHRYIYDLERNLRVGNTF